MKTSKAGLMLATMALMAENQSQELNREVVYQRTVNRTPSYKRKKCKSCKSFNKSTHNCNNENWKRHITINSTACENYKPRKK
jgi:hypothetical protein